MPPRKSTDSNVTQSKGDDEDGGSASKQARSDPKGLSVEELNLPRSMVARLAKGMLPLNTSIQKDALLALSKGATVFVNYLASNANDRAVLNNKKTIQPADVFAALNELEFPDFVDRCQQELELYNKEQCEKRNSYRKRVRQQDQPGDQTKQEDGAEVEGGMKLNGDTTSGASDGLANGDGTRARNDAPPSSKKARFSSGAAQTDDDGGQDDDDGDTIDDDEGEGEDEEGDELEDEDEEPEEEMHDAMEEQEDELEGREDDGDGEEEDDTHSD